MKREFRLRGRERWSLLVLAIVGLSAVFFWRPINRAVLTSLVLRAEKPAPIVLNELVAQASDPAHLLVRLLRTDKIPHRVLVMSYIKEHANTDSVLLQRLEPVLLSAAGDGDLQVRELALDALAACKHPDLRRLAQKALHDADPAARVLGLSYLRKAGDARLVPVVVPFLDDSDPSVIVHAALALRAWTGKDFGVRLSQAVSQLSFNEDSSKSLDQAQAETLKQGVSRWKEWWDLHRKDYAYAAAVETRQTGSSGGFPSPDFSLADLKGNLVRLSALRGKAVLINLWDTATTNYLFEIPVLNELQRQNSNRLAILSISLDSTAQERSCESCAQEHDHRAHSTSKPNLGAIRSQVQALVETRGIEYNVLIDPSGSVGYRFIGDDLPTYILVDAEGHIRRRFIGGRKLEVLQAMVNEVVQPTTAK